MRLPPLTVQVARALDEARTRARRRGHRALLPEHVLQVLLDDPLIVARLTVRAVSKQLLGDAIETRLAAMPVALSYRDANAEVRLSPASHQVLTSCAHKGLLGIVRPIGPEDLFEALEDTPSLSELFTMSQFDVDEIEDLVASARSAADERNHTNVLVEHVLIALLDEPAFANAVRRIGHKRGVVRKRLDRRLAPRFASQRLAPVGDLVARASMWANLAGNTTLLIRPIVVDLLRNAYVAASLDAIGVPRYELLYAFVHRRALEDDGHEPARRRVRIVLHDDDYTTMEHVVDVLRSTFALGKAVAEATMLRVHAEGAAAVGLFEAKDARARIAEARELSREKVMPLRFSMDAEPIG